jgi:FixJ family two-component response regulator
VLQPLDLSKAIPTISIVDDDEAVREGIEQLLQALGYNASTFGSAEEFLRSEQIHSTSCIITDLRMEGLSGLDLQDRLIAGGFRIPIIFITAHPSENARTRAMKAGALGFLSKPFNVADLIGCLEKSVQG